MRFKASNITLILAIVLTFFKYDAQAAPTLRSNGKIAFTSDRDGNSEIYLMSADGSGQTRLTNNSFRDDFPTWSPDGRTIAFMRQNGSISSINLMNADGTNQRELTRIIPNNIQGYPYERFGMSWSPDGSQIAFQDSTDIFTINIDGSNRVNLTNGQFVNYEPSWSPDGSRIAFARSIVLSHGFYPNVYTMNADGGNVTRITTSAPYGENRSPDWSPDGGRIAVDDNDQDAAYISLVNPDGTSPQHNPWGLKPKWSPDGTKIVFYESYYPAPPISQIWVMNRDGSGLSQLTNASPNNFNPDWQPLVVNVANLEELYAAVNNSANAGMLIIIAPGVYMLSVNDPNGAARPNSGRIELQQNMSLQGVAGDRGAVIIDAINLPLTSFNSAAPIPLTAAIRMGRGSNSIEWLTVRNAVNGNANIGTELASTGTAYIRVAHVASTNSQRGLDVRNFGAAGAGRVIEAEIVDNDFYNNRIGVVGEGLRIVNNNGANGGRISARLSGNRSYNNYLGLIVEDNRSNNANITVVSSGDRFFENGLGALVGAGLSGASTPSNGNTVNFTALGSSFEDNNGFNNFDHGGLIVIGGENTSIPNGTSNNTVNVELRGCRLSNNQLYDLAAFGARSYPVSVGLPGTNNRVSVRLYSTQVPILATDDSIPDSPGGMNSVVISRPAFDFDHDGRTELSMFRPSDRTWYLQGGPGGFTAMQFGEAGDMIAPADYDGDGKTDVCVFRPSNGTWYIYMSQSQSFQTFSWGANGDLPVPADHDGDGRADLVVFRPSTNTWHTRFANGTFSTTAFGVAGDKPVVGDFDGDGKSDIALYRPSDSNWYILKTGFGFFVQSWGAVGDIPTPADYDGDGKTDLAVFRPSTGQWFRALSAAGADTLSWGVKGDKPIPADYDGDGKSDVAVFRPSNSTWYIVGSKAGLMIQNYGVNGDVPTQGAFIY
ncbi:MAG: FG-GAP-like repeat-containing protein [Pyrinomonadaceae bacterium]